MRVLLDTNILLRLVATQAPEHADVVRAVASLLSRGEEPVICGQVLIELWVVATRPASVNGFGWTPAARAGRGRWSRGQACARCPA